MMAECLTATVELGRAFTLVETEVLSALIESLGGVLSELIIQELLELQEIPFILVDAHPGRALEIPSRLPSGTTLFFVGQHVGDAVCRVRAPSGAVEDVHCAYTLTDFGVYSFSRSSPQPHPAASWHLVLCETVTYRYARALDALFDSLFWSWMPGHWTEELEGAVLELCVAVDEHLGRDQQILPSAMLSSEMEILREDLRQNIVLALSGRHDPQAIGRIHQSLYGFLESEVLMPSPQFREKAVQFERAKFASSDQVRYRYSAHDAAVRECRGGAGELGSCMVR